MKIRSILWLAIGALVLVSPGTSQVPASDPASHEVLRKQVEAVAEKYKNVDAQRDNPRPEQPLSAEEFDQRLRKVLSARPRFGSLKGDFDAQTNSFKGLEHLGGDAFDCHINPVNGFYECKARFRTEEAALGSYGKIIDSLRKSTGSDPSPGTNSASSKRVTFYLFARKGPLSQYTTDLRFIFVEYSHVNRGAPYWVKISITSDEHVTPASAPSADTIAGTIAAINTNPHSALPPMSHGSGSGPVTIWNDTSSVLTFYVSGAISNKVEVGALQRTAITVPPGKYNIAGTVADTAILPFAGVRVYSGGETEHFFISSKQ